MQLQGLGIFKVAVCLSCELYPNEMRSFGHRLCYVGLYIDPNYAVCTAVCKTLIFVQGTTEVQ